MNTRDNKWKCPGKGDFSSEKELSMTKGFTDGLRFRGSLTEAQDLEKSTGKRISGEERKEPKKSSRLWWCKPGRLGGPQREILYSWRKHQFEKKDEGFGLGHPKFQAMAKQSKEKHRVWRVIKWVRPTIHPASHLTMALIQAFWESMGAALYDIVLKTFGMPSHPNVLNLPFMKALSSTNLIKSF